MKSPLQIAILFHPDSTVASSLATGLFETLAAGPDDAGLRIPISFHASAEGIPPKVDLDGADHTLVVALVDSRMARRVLDSDPADAWADLVHDLFQAAPPTSGNHALFPVAVDKGAFSLDPDRLGDVSFVRLDYLSNDQQLDQLLFRVCVAALRLFKGDEVSPDSTEKAPIEVFISHAKADLPENRDGGDDDPVHALIEELGTSPVDHWYDAKDIPPGGRFDEEIEEGVLQCSALIAVVTNEWSSREWCRREILEAKEARRPILIVDHITDENPRLFPYLGNAPVIRWKNRQSAFKVVTFAIRESLRYRFNLASMSAEAGSEVEVFGTKPELLSVTALDDSTKKVLYPDPPIGEEELRELRRVSENIEFTTPLSKFANFQPVDEDDAIALSLSAAPDSHLYGGSPAHLAVLADDLNLFLLLAGFSIAYGGSLIPGGIDFDEDNFMERLLSLAKSYSPVARRLGLNEGFKPIKNYVAWPIHLSYGDDEYDQYERVATMECVPRPEALDTDSLNIPDDGFFGPSNGSKRFAWACGLTEMREAMRDAPEICARVALGGKLSGYSGRYPGVLEEVLLDLRAESPVFLIGAFGGAARLVLDALAGNAREELTSDWMREYLDFYDEIREIHHDNGLEMKSPEELGDELHEIGRDGLGDALNNGLSNDENKELLTSTQPRRMVELILTGLSRLAETRTQSSGG